jgi:hypothetical protein
MVQQGIFTCRADGPVGRAEYRPVAPGRVRIGSKAKASRDLEIRPRCTSAMLCTESQNGRQGVRQQYLVELPFSLHLLKTQNAFCGNKDDPSSVQGASENGVQL